MNPPSRSGSKRYLVGLGIVAGIILGIWAIRNFPAPTPVANPSDLATIAGDMRSVTSEQLGQLDAIVSGIKQKDQEIAQLKQERDDLRKKLEKFEAAANLFREASAPPGK